MPPPPSFVAARETVEIVEVAVARDLYASRVALPRFQRSRSGGDAVVRLVGPCREGGSRTERQQQANEQ